MNDVNKVVIIGRLTRDVGEHFAYTSGGTAKANISIACNESVKSGGQWEERVSFFDVTIWGRTAEHLKQYLTKGKQVAIEGKLRQDRWTDQSGQNRTKVYINAETVQLLGGSAQGGSGSYQAAGDKTPESDNGGNYREGEYPEEIPF